MKKITTLSLVLMLLSVPAMLWAEDLPSAEKVINKFIEASGGLEVWEGHSIMKATGSFAMPAMGISAKIEVYKKAPNMIHTSIVSDAFGNMEEGFDGTVAWEKSMMTGSKIKTGSELAMSRRMAQFNPWAVWKDDYQSATNQGVEKVDEVDCYRIEMVPHEGEGEPEMNFFAVDSGLLLKTSSVLVNEMGRITVDAYLMDYRESEGVLAPYKVRQVLMGMQEMVMTFEEQTFKAEAPEGLFDLPEDVKALLEKK